MVETMFDEYPDEPKQHLARPALPWRDDEVTECGRPVAGLSLLTRDELLAKVKKQGKTRASMSTCMTCWETSTRWKTWAESPVDVMRREVPAWYGDSRSERLNTELRAIEALVAAHRQDFDEFVQGLSQTDDLGAARKRRRREAARAARSPRPL